jgi:CRP/FNR family transcriptional regulator, anaerobic regulatory protein
MPSMSAAPTPLANQTHCAICPLRATAAFTEHTPMQLDFIQSLKKSETLGAPGELIVSEGETIAELHTILSGWAFRFRTLSNGRRQILNFLLPGDFIGLQAQLSDGAPHGVELLTQVRMCTFSSHRLWDIYRLHPELGYDLTWLVAHEELIVDENLLTAGQRTAPQRIAMLLVHLFKRAEQVGMKHADGSVPFPINQQHMADALGLSLVHTNRSLRRLAEAGLHVIADGRLRLLKPNVLRRLADYYAMPLRKRPLI